MAKVNERDWQVARMFRAHYAEDAGAEAIAAYREEIEARYAGVVEALENYITHQSEVRESCKPKCDVYVQAKVALAKIGRG